MTDNNQETVEGITGTVPLLKIGDEYTIRSYPDSVLQIAGVYLGQGNWQGFGATHVFVHRGEVEDTYILADDYWLREIKGELTYKPTSSALLPIITDQEINELEDTKFNRQKSTLIALLRDVGEKK